MSVVNIRHSLKMLLNITSVLWNLPWQYKLCLKVHSLRNKIKKCEKKIKKKKKESSLPSMQTGLSLSLISWGTPGHTIKPCLSHLKNATFVLALSQDHNEIPNAVLKSYMPLNKCEVILIFNSNLGNLKQIGQDCLFTHDSQLATHSKISEKAWLHLTRAIE